jgi:hypothetical protein
MRSYNWHCTDIIGWTTSGSSVLCVGCSPRPPEADDDNEFVFPVFAGESEGGSLTCDVCLQRLSSIMEPSIEEGK